MIELHKLKTLKPKILHDFKRADLEIYGIDHFRPSYTALVFLNCDEKDPKKLGPDHPDCAGRFSVFGHENCTGNEGHCSVTVPQRFDTRRSHPLTKAFKRVELTHALRTALSIRKTLQITIMVADEEGMAKRNKKRSAEKGKALFSCDRFQVVTFA